MNVSAIPTLNHATGTTESLNRARVDSFAKTLDSARTVGTDSETAFEAAQQLVSIALVQPLLAQMHDDPFRSDLFHGGFAEDTFQKHLDSNIADRVVKSARNGIDHSSPKLPIVDAIHRHLMKRVAATQRTMNVNG